MRGCERGLALIIMLAGTVALAGLAYRLFGLWALVIAGALGLLITAGTLRL
jgi:hypothetical protein